MSLDQQELTQIGQILTDYEDKKEAERCERVAKRKAAKRLRRVILVLFVLAACATTHYIIESNEIQWVAQSLELMMAAFFEGLFGTVRE